MNYFCNSVLIFEDYNLIQDKKDEIYSWLYNKGYITYSEGGICEAIKENN